MIEIGDFIPLYFNRAGKALCPVCENRYLTFEGDGYYSCFKNHRIHVTGKGIHRIADYKIKLTVKDKIKHLLGERFGQRFGWWNFND